MAVNLVKGQRISLEKTAGKTLGTVRMGLGWDMATEGTEIDLDGSCLVLDANKKMIEAIWYGDLKSKNQSIVHSGDNLTGEGEGDDEVITVKLNEVSPDAKYLAFTVTSYSGHRFPRIENAFCRVVDESGTEICRYQLSDMEDKTAMVIATLYRHNDEWKFRAIGEFAIGATVMDIVGIVQRVV
ncbi:MAG: TerD family protein [Bacteroidota bacterium]